MTFTELINLLRLAVSANQPEATVQELIRQIEVMAKDQMDRPHMHILDYVAYIKEKEGHGSKSAFAERIGWDLNTLNRMLRGESAPRFTTMEKIKEASDGLVREIDDFKIQRKIPRKR